MVLLDLCPDPNTLILLQTKAHKRQLDSEASPSDNNLEFEKIQQDVCKYESANL